MFGQQGKVPILLLVLTMPTALAFVPAAASSSSQKTERMLAVDPLDITSMHDQIADHSPTLDAIMSTLYASAAKLQPAHGHEQPLFGSPDPYLSKFQSIVPNANYHPTTPTLAQESDIPDKIRGAIDYARRGDFVDPTTISRVDGAAPPGFDKFNSIWSTAPNRPISQTTDYTLGVLNQEVRNLRALQKIPIAAFLTVVVDFFLVTPGMDIYKEEIDEDGDLVNKEAAVAGAARVAVLAVVAGATLVLS